MNYRLATVFPAKEEQQDVTEIIDLNVRDPISRLTVINNTRAGGSMAPLGHPATVVTKIELVDGSDVLYSLSGVEAKAADWYTRQQKPADIHFAVNNNWSEISFPMNFGRFLYDPVLALDPTKFDNLQLKITLDLDAWDTNAGYSNLTVVADLFDGKAVSPTGFLMHKEIKDYALGAGTHEYTDLPTDHPIRKLFLRIQKYGVGTEYCFGNIKISEDNDKKVPMNHPIASILRTLVSNAPPYEDWIVVIGDPTGVTMYNVAAYWPAFAATHFEAGQYTNAPTVHGGDGGRGTIYGGHAGIAVQVLGQGWCPFGVVEIPFGLQDDLTDWYDVAALGALELDVTAGGGMLATDSCQVFLQQLRAY